MTFTLASKDAASLCLSGGLAPHEHIQTAHMHACGRLHIFICSLDPLPCVQAWACNTLAFTAGKMALATKASPALQQLALEANIVMVDDDDEDDPTFHLGRFVSVKIPYTRF